MRKAMMAATLFEACGWSWWDDDRVGWTILCLHDISYSPAKKVSCLALGKVLPSTAALELNILNMIICPARVEIVHFWRDKYGHCCIADRMI